jgi:hypothetical protein
MLSSTLHRKWAREYLERAARAQSGSRKLGYLRLAVANGVRAQAIEATEKSEPPFTTRRPFCGKVALGRMKG